MHRRDHRLGDARRRADRVLEGADVGARLERAAGGVRVLREREQLGHCGGWGVAGVGSVRRLLGVYFWGGEGGGGCEIRWGAGRG